MLWAVELVADRESGKKLDPKLGVGSFVRDWCWNNGMILRNNGDILVYAPALTMSKEVAEEMLTKTEGALTAAMKHYGY
jgi:putrescine---pyruvate transaminase